MLSNLYRNIADFYTKKRTPRLLKKRKCVFRKKGDNCQKYLRNNSETKWFLDFLKDKNFCRNDYVYAKNVAYLIIPEKFSFTSNPVETIYTLQRLVGMYYDSKVKKIDINHCNCEELELSASLIMDAILWEIDCRRKRIGKKIIISGIMKREKHNKNNENILELLACSGVLKHLGVLNNDNVPSHIETLDFYDDYIKLHKNVDHKYSGEAVAKYFDRCYQKCGFKISDEGINKISNLVSEIVLNCDNHSGKKPNRWFCQGHYHVGENKECSGLVGECQLTIVSLGYSFYESIENCGTDYIRNKLSEQYTKVVGVWRNFFGKLRKGKERDVFYLLYCLQENISRYKDDSTSLDRGKGTVTLFENFQELGMTSDGKSPILSITSGSGHIVFDGKYKMMKSGEGVSVIAFNSNNDLNEEPDNTYVNTIKSFFPGVIINLKFYIDKAYLENLVEDRS